MVMGVSRHTTHMKLTPLVYFNNENDKMTIEKRYHVQRLMAHYSQTGYFNSESFLTAIHKSGIKYLDETSENYQNELENNEFIINDENQFEHTNLFSENQNEIENNDEIQTTTISPSKKESSEARRIIQSAKRICNEKNKYNKSEIIQCKKTLYEKNNVENIYGLFFNTLTGIPKSYADFKVSLKKSNEPKTLIINEDIFEDQDNHMSYKSRNFRSVLVDSKFLIKLFETKYGTLKKKKKKKKKC